MDVLGILGALKRHRLLSLIIVVLTIGGAGLIYVKSPTYYEASATYALPNPNTPTAAQLQADPALAKLNSNNPYLYFPDQTTIVGVLSAQMTSTAEQARLRGAGAQGSYSVGPSNSISAGGRLVEVRARTNSPGTAINTVNVVSKEMTRLLHSMQAVNGAAEQYIIPAVLVTPAEQATAKVSGKLRSAIIMIVVGIIALFAAISIADAIGSRRPRRQPSRAATLHNVEAPGAPSPQLEMSPIPRTSAWTTPRRVRRRRSVPAESIADGLVPWTDSQQQPNVRSEGSPTQERAALAYKSQD